MTTSSAFNRLFLVLLLIALFCAYSITRALVDPHYDPFASTAVFQPLIPLFLLALLWAAYRHWLKVSGSGEDLLNVFSSISPVALIVVSPDRTIRMCNPAVNRVFGYAPEELLNRKTEVLYNDRRTHPDKHAEVYEALEQQGFHVGTAEGIRRNGQRFPLEIITGNLTGESGAVMLLRDITDHKWAEEQMRKSRDALQELVHKRTDRLVTTLDDLLQEISERKQAEETVKKLNQELERRVSERTRELKTAYEDLKQIDRLKDDFLSTVSHEFRTPLTSIMSFSEILLDFPDESVETKREFYSIIYNESQRLSRLINDLLDLSKIQAGKMEWRRKRLQAAELVDVALQAVQGLATKNGLRLEKEVQPGLPPFYGDPDRILQVLINLLGNAIKFTPQGGRVRIRAARGDPADSGAREPRIHFSVEDSGMGIEPQELERIFESFSQCKEDTNKKPSGTGLGLPICRRIVSAHRGKIWAESSVGSGSTFHVLLPLDRRDPKSPASLDPRLAAPAEGRLLH